MDSNLGSSTEELSLEQRMMLLSSKRQEPQGEEHKGNDEILQNREHNNCSNVASTSAPSATVHYVYPSSPRRMASSSVSRSSSSESSSDCEDCDSNSIEYSCNLPASAGVTGSSRHISNPSSAGCTTAVIGNKCHEDRNSKNMSLDSNSHSTYNTLIIHRNNSSLLADTWIPACLEFTSIPMENKRSSTCSNSEHYTKSSVGKSGEMSASNANSDQTLLQDSHTNLVDIGVTSNEISEIPRDYLDQLTVLKHLAKEVQQDPGTGSQSQNLLRSATFSRSQPDLSQPAFVRELPVSCSHDYETPVKHTSKKKKHAHGNNSSNPQENCQKSSHCGGEETLPSVQILEILMRENSSLKAELVSAHRRINAIHKLEAELTRLQSQHSALFESSERRESLERTARAKLSTEVKRLTAVNRELLCSSNSLQNLSPYNTCSDVEIYKKELAKKDLTIAQLVSQNKELVATKERQEIELAAQRATLVEQRAHIDILDSALTNSQANVLRLEEESREKQEYVEKVSQLQRALSSMQLSNDKREKSEKKIRTQLDSEISDLKIQLATANDNNQNRMPVVHHFGRSNGNTSAATVKAFISPPPYPGVPNSANGGQQNKNEAQRVLDNELQCLQDKIKLSEDKIVNLSSQVVRWENFFSDKAASSPAVTTSTPNTPNSWSSRGDTPHFFGGSSGGNGNGSGSSSAPDDLSTTQTRATDLEWKIKDLESRLVERDAMIRVLQHVPPAIPPYNSLYSPIIGSEDVPTYCSAGAKMLPVATSHPPIINHQISVSLASSIDRANNSHNMSHAHGSQNSGILGAERIMDASLMYSKLGNSGSELPAYSSKPSKLRFGGSGSSLAKTSSESLGSASFGLPGRQTPTSAPGSDSSAGSNSKSIDEQLKELDHQLLSKGGPDLKMQSGLCCIPGFSHPSSAARKGKIPQSLLESLSGTTSTSSNSSGKSPNLTNASSIKKQAVLPPLPKPPTFSSQSSVGGHHSQTAIRTSSGPPFISPSASSSSIIASCPVGTTSLSLSNSVDSMLNDKQNCKKGAVVSNYSVFAPASSSSLLPKGLPPKSPGIPEAGKCRSLEREQRNKCANEPGAGKYTLVNYDASRCKSLDRRDTKANAKIEQKANKEKEEKEKKFMKSSVTSKAAFFGGLLTRRSPSPSRQKEKDKEMEAEINAAANKISIVQPKVVRFPFSRTPQPTCAAQETGSNTNNEQDVDTAFLDMQGRSSQRNRISKWTLSHSNLEAVQEQPGSSGSSPWSKRRSGGTYDKNWN